MTVKDRKLIDDMIKNAQLNISKRTGVKVILTPTFPIQDCENDLKKILEEMCYCWGFTLAWVSEKSREKDRPIMRKLLWMASRELFPAVTYVQLAILTGVDNHVTILKGIQKGRDWLKVQDEKFLKYYKQVKHFFHEPVDE